MKMWLLFLILFSSIAYAQYCFDYGLGCDCTTVPDKAYCEDVKQDLFDALDPGTQELLVDCLNDLDNCECNFDAELNEFCETQKRYAYNCTQRLECDMMTELKVLPYNYLGLFKFVFKQTVKKKYEKIARDNAREAIKIYKACEDDVMSCECDKMYDLESFYCEKKKIYYVNCTENGGESCSFFIGFRTSPELEAYGAGNLFANSVDEVYYRIAVQMGNVMLDCVDRPDKCNCYFLLGGHGLEECERKRNLLYSCRIDKDFDKCMILDTEPILPDDTPYIIRRYIHDNIEPQLDQLKLLIYDDVKPPECEDLKYSECRDWWLSNNTA